MTVWIRAATSLGIAGLLVIISEVAIKIDTTFRFCPEEMKDDAERLLTHAHTNATILAAGLKHKGAR